MSDGFRTPQTAEQYRAHRASGALERSCPLCDTDPLEQFTHWKIIPNAFPYDRIAKQHDMVVPLRHVDEDGLTEEESIEYQALKRTRLQDYEYIIEASSKNKSIPAHFHLHLLVAKKELHS